MSTKALKSQLLAAVAMVLVASIALGSSTFAWFAANNNVKADMASISATSDAAFLEIKKDGDSWSNLTTVEYTEASAKELLPARFKADSATYFETAFASAPDAATIKDGSATDVTSANLAKYVWKETVHIRAQSGTFNNLTLSALSIQKANEDSGLISAGRILAVCGTAKQVWQSGSKVSGDTYLSTANFTNADDIVVDLYFYYDGDDANVFTNNITALKAIKGSVTFTADQVTV